MKQSEKICKMITLVFGKNSKDCFFVAYNLMRGNTKKNLPIFWVPLEFSSHFMF